MVQPGACALPAHGVIGEIVDEITSSIDVIKYSFYKDDGSVISSTMQEENTGKMAKLVKFYSRQMQLNNYFVQDSGETHLVLYRVSRSIFILLISTASIESITNVLVQIHTSFAEQLDAFYHIPDTFEKITRHVVISQALDMGPEPVATWPEGMHNDMKMKIAMKSMLLLTAERDGAIRGIPATIPFIEYKSMGIIYLFDVPHPGARGGAHDSAISILVDEGYRPAIYENMYSLETTCQEAADAMRSGASLASVIDSMLVKLGDIQLKKNEGRKAAEIQKIMKEQVKRITRELA